jgi:hypothetical protein
VNSFAKNCREFIRLESSWHPAPWQLKTAPTKCTKPASAG